MTADAILGAPVMQIAFVVTDLEAALRRWADALDVKPWRAYTLGPPRLQGTTVRGESVTFSFRHALAWSGRLQVELIQPLDGPTIFAEHLAQHGEGVHHVGIVVPDHAAASALLVERGFTLLQSGHGFGLDGSGRFAYFEPPHGIGTIVELIDPPTVRAEPELVYPDGD
jgi:catechol 2,3-dioxygenase-like lactoylglutathione lyase family enzyme